MQRHGQRVFLGKTKRIEPSSVLPGFDTTALQREINVQWRMTVGQPETGKRLGAVDGIRGVVRWSETRWRGWVGIDEERRRIDLGKGR